MFNDHIMEHHQNTKHIFTDGSRRDELVGCAAVTEHITVSRRLIKETGIFTAELFALLDAVLIIRKTNENQNTIFSDSQGAIKALMMFNSSNPLVCRILHHVLHILDHGKMIKFCWVPAHIDVPGNERADAAAGMGAIDGPLNRSTTLYKDHYPIFRKKILQQWQNR